MVGADSGMSGGTLGGLDRATARMLMGSLNRDAERIAARFGLRYKVIEPERANVVSRYGVCYSDGAIKIRLRHARTGLPLKYSSLVNTLCHELAHLRHFNHGPHFRSFYQELLAFARSVGIYRPAAKRAAPWSRTAPVREEPRSSVRPGLPNPTERPPHDPQEGRPVADGASPSPRSPRSPRSRSSPEQLVLF